MGRKKISSKTKSIVNLEATLRKVQSTFLDPNMVQWMGAGGMKGTRERLLRINFSMLRNCVERLPLINGIINTRCDQITPFCVYTDNLNERGFTLDWKGDDDDAEGPKAEKKQLREFILQTGFEYDSLREDDFVDFCTMLVRERYTIDQVATEVQMNRQGQAVAFWLLDGATIYRVTDDESFKRGVRYVQMIQDQVKTEYQENLIFDYRHKRADIKYRGYGYAEVEMAIDVITTLLFGYTHIRDQLVRDKMPRGFISVMGDAGKPQLDSIRNYWYAAMSGAGGQWNIPILPSGKDGVGIDFKPIGHSNKEMEFRATIMLVSSLIGAVFGIDLQEMGLRTDDATTVIGESSYNKSRTSRERGLAAELSFIQQYMNKIIRKVSKDWVFKFTGLDPEDLEKKAIIRSQEVSTHKTVDDIRQEDNLKPFNEEWSKIPLNPQVVQLYLAAKQAEQMQQAQEQQASMGGGGEMPEEQQGAEKPQVEGGIDEDAWMNGMTKSLRIGNKSIRVRIG